MQPCHTKYDITLFDDRSKTWLIEKGAVPQMIETGDWVKKARKAVGMTAADLADKAMVSLNHIQRIEQGSRLPSPAVMEKIEQALGVSQASASFDTTELFADLEDNIIRFGPDAYCWLTYKPVGNCVCFTEHHHIALGTPLTKAETKADERAFITTYAEALEWIKRQDSLL